MFHLSEYLEDRSFLSTIILIIFSTFFFLCELLPLPQAKLFGLLWYFQMAHQSKGSASQLMDDLDLINSLFARDVGIN